MHGTVRAVDVRSGWSRSGGEGGSGYSIHALSARIAGSNSARRRVRRPVLRAARPFRRPRHNTSHQQTIARRRLPASVSSVEMRRQIAKLVRVLDFDKAVVGTRLEMTPEGYPPGMDVHRYCGVLLEKHTNPDRATIKWDDEGAGGPPASDNIVRPYETREWWEDLGKPRAWQPPAPKRRASIVGRPGSGVKANETGSAPQSPTRSLARESSYRTAVRRHGSGLTRRGSRIGRPADDAANVSFTSDSSPSPPLGRRKRSATFARSGSSSRFTRKGSISGLSRKGSAKVGLVSPKGKKSKDPIELAEDRVKDAFTSESLDWARVREYAED